MKAKRFLSTVLSICLAVLTLFSFVGCDEQTIEAYGKLYSLQEAYAENLLTQEDLKSLAYYNNGGVIYNEEILPEDFQPIEQPTAMDQETERKIKHDVVLYKKKYDMNVTMSDVEDIVIHSYFGAYNGCQVFIGSVQFFTEGHIEYNDWQIKETVGGLTFYYKLYSYRITVWKSADKGVN